MARQSNRVEKRRQAAVDALAVINDCCFRVRLLEDHARTIDRATGLHRLVMPFFIELRGLHEDLSRIAGAMSEIERAE